MCDTIAENPHATAVRIASGLMLQVCETPLEAITAEGISRLTAATTSLPPAPLRAPGGSLRAA